MKHFLIFACTLGAPIAACGKGEKIEATIWELDSRETIGGHRPTVLGDPVVIQSPRGPAIQFDGKDDGLIFDTNPLAGCSAFTIEVIFRPDAGGNPEQRFLHMQEADDRRVLIETRLTPDNRWFLDTFMKSDESERTLYAEEFLHPVGEWFHAALVYEDQEMRHYVNGREELRGAVSFEPMRAGQTSAGCRLNRVYWFKGAIKLVKFIRRALLPREFVPL